MSYVTPDVSKEIDLLNVSSENLSLAVTVVTGDVFLSSLMQSSLWFIHGLCVGYIARESIYHTRLFVKDSLSQDCDIFFRMFTYSKSVKSLSSLDRTICVSSVKVTDFFQMLGPRAAIPFASNGSVRTPEDKRNLV